MRKSLLLILVLIGLQAGSPGNAAAGSASDPLERADALFARRNYREALGLYQAAIPGLSDSTALGLTQTRIGDCNFQLGAYQKARNAYREALPFAAEDSLPEIRYWIGFCSFLIGRHDEAVKEFLKIPELHPRSGVWVSTAYYWAGRASERLGRKDEAGRYYRKAAGDGKSSQGRHALNKAEALKKGGERAAARH